MSKKTPDGINGPKVSRRTFAKSSVAVVTAAVTLPDSLFGAPPRAPAATTPTHRTVPRAELPGEAPGYGGRGAPRVPITVSESSGANGWKEGVHPDAVDGRDYDPDNVKALWHVTTTEDIWLTDNHHLGIQSGGYSSGRYATHEGSPARFVKWYMEQFVDAGD